jgi:hypothetical protein
LLFVGIVTHAPIQGTYAMFAAALAVEYAANEKAIPREHAPIR